MLQRLKEHYALAVIVALYLILGLTYSVVVPLFEAPDEPSHFAHILYLQRRLALPFEPNPDHPDFIETAGHPPLYYFLGALVTAWLDTSDYVPSTKNPYFEYGAESLGANVFVHSAAENFPYRGAALAVHLLRGFSLLLGAGTIIATYVLARVIFPQGQWYAGGAAAFVAFLPQFVFISASVNSDNGVNFFCALALIQIVRVGNGTAARTRDLLALGALVGLANLSKGSAIVLLPLAALAIFLGASNVGWRVLLLRAVKAGLAFVVVAGWWYVRNLLLYGDPLGLNYWAIADAALARTVPVDAEQLQDFARSAWASFWAAFGWGNLGLAAWVYIALLTIVALALVGLIYRVAREWRERMLPRRAFLLLALDVVGVAVLFYNYWVTLPAGGNQGRYMFTALAPLALLFVYGIAAYFPRRWRHAAPLCVGAGFFAFSASVPFLLLAPAYQPFVPTPALAAAQVPAMAERVNLTLGDIRVYAFEAPSRELQRGEGALVTIYFQALRQPRADLNVSVKLVSADGRVLWSRLRRPGRGRAPTDLWQSGAIYADPFPVRAPANAPLGAARFTVGFYTRGGAVAAQDATLVTFTVK